MSFFDDNLRRRSLALAFAVSLLVHGGVLLLPRSEKPEQALPRLEARLAPRPRAITPAPIPSQEAVQTAPPPQRQQRSRMMTSPKSRGPAVADNPKWTTAQREDMKRFLDELDAQPKPTLAQRSMAMARQQGSLSGQRDQDGFVTLERKPNTPPPDPFSLDFYMDALLKKLNRSAAFVRSDPRARGMHNAAIQFRLNPDGSLKSFDVLNAGDQGAEIAFLRAVVERAAPFSPFPADIDRAAKSLGVTICIIPTGSGDGFGFSRLGGGQHC